MQKLKTNKDAPWAHGNLRPRADGRVIEHTDGTPFFWLGDTAWLLFSRLDREEAKRYLDDRREKGFNVIQIMVVHRTPNKNIYGGEFDSFDSIDWASGPPMDDPNGYWSLVDEMIKLAEERGLYAALVPAWGSVAKSGALDAEMANKYGSWLGRHFKDRPNIIWLNGGDIQGDVCTDVWHALGSAIKKHDPNHIMTFHPFGRTASSKWFHDADWLDFNSFQSGHRRTDQCTEKDAGDENGPYGEDSWRYVLADLERTPQKPTLDSEPSYEGIPQGLHDPKEPFWEAHDVRRYAYWAMAAGAFGHTYGHSAIMQMHKPQFAPGAYGVRENVWTDALDAPGAGQMRHLRSLFESVDYAHGQYAPEIVLEGGGEKYERLIPNRGPGYALVYAYTAQAMTIDLAAACPNAKHITAEWFIPSDGSTRPIGTFAPEPQSFDPKIDSRPGNDIVLILRNTNT